MMGGGAGSYCGRLLMERGRRRCPETLMGLAESHLEGCRMPGTPLSPSRKWRRGYGDKEAPCGFTFEKEAEADT